MTSLEMIWKELQLLKQKVNEINRVICDCYDQAHEKSQADIEYVAMMTDVDMNENDT